MKFINLKRLLWATFVSAALLCSASSLATTPVTWKDTGFSINAKDLSLRKVLEEFGAVYAVGLSIGIDANHIVGGKLQSSSGSEFLDRLSVTHKFRWFVYNDVLYITPRNDNIAVRLQVGEDAVQDAKGALLGVGLFDTRFGWGELPDEGVVLVSGPREYVNLAREILLPDGKKPAALIGKQLMVFRLKYASATDRTISTRGQREVIPGLKTILNGLLNGGAGVNGNSAYGGRSPDQLTDGSGRLDVSSNKRSRTGNIGRGGAREVGGSARAQSARIGREDDYANDADADNSDNAPAERKSSKSKRDDKPKIDADASLNALIIYDDVSKRERYQELINQLDLEPQQIEIEALIIDINRGLLSDFGVEWGVQIGNVDININGSSNDRTTSQNSQSPAGLPIPGSTLLITNPARFYARIRALEGSNEGRVLAKPTVLTLENVAAVLDINNSRYIPLTGERVADLANITAGTMLRVLPRIIRNGNDVRIRLDVDIEDGSILDNNGPNNSNSNVSRSTITTQAIVENHHTLLVGGYNSESRQRNENKIPILGDVPLVGGLFRNSTTTSNNRERLFLITPRLADNSYNVRANGLSSAAQRFRKMSGQKGQTMNIRQLEDSKKPDDKPLPEEKIISQQTSGTSRVAATKPPVSVASSVVAPAAVLVPAPVAPTPVFIPAPVRNIAPAIKANQLADADVPAAIAAPVVVPTPAASPAKAVIAAVPPIAPVAAVVNASPKMASTTIMPSASSNVPMAPVILSSPSKTIASPLPANKITTIKSRVRSGSNTDLALQL